MIKILDTLLSVIMVPFTFYYVTRLIRLGSDARWLFWLSIGFLGEAVFSLLDHDSAWIVVMLAGCSILYLVQSFLPPTPSLRQLWAQRND